MINQETHTLSRWSRLVAFVRPWVEGFLFVIALLAIHGLVRVNDEAVALRAEVSYMKTVACPQVLGGMNFTFSAFERINLTRPKYARLSCFYAKAKT